MKFEWNELKREQNIIKHQLDFVDAIYFFDEPFLVKKDERFDYGEQRYIALGLILGRVVVLVFSQPEDNKIRIISFRKANKREARYYYENI